MIGGDLSVFIQGVTEVVGQLNKDVLDSFLLDLGHHGNMPISMAVEIATALHEE